MSLAVDWGRVMDLVKCVVKPASIGLIGWLAFINL